MREFLESFSNREIAIVFWLIIIFFFVTIVAPKKIFSVIKILFSKVFFPFYLIFITYSTLLIFYFNYINIWEIYLYKDFIFWFFTTATISFFKSKNINNWNQLNYLVLKVFSWNMIIEFLIDNYNFTLGFEIIFIAIITFIGTLYIFATTYKEREGYSAVAKILNIFLGASGCALLFYAITQFINKYNDTLNISNLKSFLFSPIFTLLFSPFIIFTVFFIKYDTIFLALNRYNFLDSKRKFKIKLAIFKYANLNFEYIKNAHDILIWQKKELKNNKSISQYLKKAVKSKIEKDIINF